MSLIEAGTDWKQLLYVQMYKTLCWARGVNTCVVLCSATYKHAR